MNSTLSINNLKASYNLPPRTGETSSVPPMFPELDIVMTIEEAVIIYNATVYEVWHDVVVNPVMPSRQSGKTWIIRVADALARWGSRA